MQTTAQPIRTAWIAGVSRWAMASETARIAPTSSTEANTLGSPTVPAIRLSCSVAVTDP